MIEVGVAEGEGDVGYGDFLGTQDYKPVPHLSQVEEIQAFFMNDQYIFGRFKGRSGENLFDSATGKYSHVGRRFNARVVVDLPQLGEVFGQEVEANEASQMAIWKLPEFKKVACPADMDFGTPFAGKDDSLIGVYDANKVSFYDLRTGRSKFFEFDSENENIVRVLDPEMRKGKILESDRRVVVGSYDAKTGKFDRILQGKVTSANLEDWDVRDSPSARVFPDSVSDGFWVVSTDNPHRTKWHSLIFYVNKDFQVEKVFRTNITISYDCAFDPEHYAILSKEMEERFVEFPLN